MVILPSSCWSIFRSPRGLFRLPAAGGDDQTAHRRRHFLVQLEEALRPRLAHDPGAGTLVTGGDLLDVIFGAVKAWMGAHHRVHAGGLRQGGEALDLAVIDV